MKNLIFLTLITFFTYSSHAQAARPSIGSIQASIDTLAERFSELEAALTELRVEDHVVLVWVSPGSGVATFCRQPNKEFRRFFPDGSFATEAFVVPTGKIMVATDVDGTVSAGFGNTFNVGNTVHVTLTMETNVNSSLVPHMTSGIQVTNPTLKVISVSSQLGTGVLIGSGLQVCVRGDEREVLGGYFFHDVKSATVRGYLVDDPAQ